MPSLAGPTVTESQMWGVTPFDQLWCRIQFRKLRYDGEFTPPSVQGTLKFPGFAGGMNWGSASVDPERQILLVSESLRQRDQTASTRHQNRLGARPPVPGRSRRRRRRTRPGCSASSPLFKPVSNRLRLPDCDRLRTRRVIWNRPFGTARDVAPQLFARTAHPAQSTQHGRVDHYAAA